MLHNPFYLAHLEIYAEEEDISFIHKFLSMLLSF